MRVMLCFRVCRRTLLNGKDLLMICMMLDIAVACHLRPRNSVVIITRCCDSHNSISKRASADSSKQFVWRCCSNSLLLCRRKTCARQSSSHWCVLQRIIQCTSRRCTSCYRVLPRALFLGSGEHGAWDTCSAGATASTTCNVVSTRFLCYAAAHLSPSLSARPPAAHPPGCATARQLVHCR